MPASWQESSSSSSAARSLATMLLKLNPKAAFNTFSPSTHHPGSKPSLFKDGSRARLPLMGDTNNMKNGMTLEMDGSIWKVVEFLHVKPGKGAAFVRSKLKNLENGKTLDKTWNAGEKFDDAEIERKKMLYSYLDGEDFVFMDMETFEEERMKKDSIENGDFLEEQKEYQMAFWNGKAIDIVFPDKISLKIVGIVDPGRADTKSGVNLQTVKLENGMQVKVPDFVKDGETITLDTNTREYLSREKKSKF